MHFIDLPEPSLLESGAAGHPLSRFSFLAADPVSSIAASAGEWPAVRERIRATLVAPPSRLGHLPPFQGGWVGWFTYELATAFDRIARHANEPCPVPDIALGLYDWVIAWDHLLGDIWLISSGIDATGQGNPHRARERADAVLAHWRTNPPVRSAATASPDIAPRSDFTGAAYQATVERVVEYVIAGDIFQANLAQRFSLPFGGDALALYADLTRRSAAPMAAFVWRGNVSIASVSPERFVRLEMPTRRVETRPIKGTRRRDADAARDSALAQDLRSSEKDRAENVMIVDLMRNDLSRVCVPGSVRTPELCALESHPTVHHLVSIVTGELRADQDALDLLAATFPGGSITGAPKLRAMEIIGELEPVARGVYSGSIAWIGLDGAMDTSIAIRTATVAGGIATWHSGGGITAQSAPIDEYQETLDKARALSAAVMATR